jgi:hypothetical protein
MLFATWKYSNSKIFRGVNIMEFIMESTGVRSDYLNTVTKLLECGVAESGGGGFSYALTRIVLTAPHMFILTLIIILYLIVNRIIMPIFGTIILGALPCFALCCKHYEEDTVLTVQEAIDEGKLQGSKSYDITSNRAYAAMFGLDEEELDDAESGQVHNYSLPENDDGDEKEELVADTNEIGLEMVEKNDDRENDGEEEQEEEAEEDAEEEQEEEVEEVAEEEQEEEEEAEEEAEEEKDGNSAGENDDTQQEKNVESEGKEKTNEGVSSSSDSEVDEESEK